MSTAAEIKGLTRSYSGKTVLNGLSLTVKSGTVFGLLGANGAGKSTAIECMLGIKKADSGSSVLLGLDPKSDRRRLFWQVGVQFQESEYQTEIKVKELCEETACLYSDPDDYKELCGRFGIGDKLNSQVKSLSGGERQRLFIVLALIPKPRMVFLDELTTGLDARARRDVWKILSELKGKGLTIFLTSHFMDEVELSAMRYVFSEKALPYLWERWTMQRKNAAAKNSRTHILSYRRKASYETIFHTFEKRADTQYP